jgi:pimeloyl-ACP methyl ester carboxylesterase
MDWTRRSLRRQAGERASPIPAKQSIPGIRVLIERPVVVGHSMGGEIALELAARKSHRLAGVVVLDAAVLPAAEIRTAVQPVIAVIR